MALTRKFLSALGIEAEKIDEIITAHTETVDALKEQRDEYKANAEKYKEDADKLPTVQKELDDLKAADGQNDYAKLKKEFEDYKAEVKAEKEHAEKEAAYREILKDAGIAEKNMAKVLKYTDFDTIEMADGKIKDAKKCIKDVKEEWPELIVTETEKGARTSNPPKNEGGGTMTKAEILAIKDRAERRKAIAENPQAFSQLKDLITE